MNAKEIFYHCRGNRFLMERTGLLDEYQLARVTEKQEQQWIEEASNSFFSMPFYDVNQAEDYFKLCEMMKKSKDKKMILSVLRFPEAESKKISDKAYLMILSASADFAVNCARKERISADDLRKTSVIMKKGLQTIDLTAMDQKQIKQLQNIKETWEGLSHYGDSH